MFWVIKAQVCNSHRFFIVFFFMLFCCCCCCCFFVFFILTKFTHYFNLSSSISSGAPNDHFLLYTLKTLSGLSKVLLDLYKYILKAALKNFHMFGHTRGLWVFLKLQRVQNYFPEKFSGEREWEFFRDFYVNYIFESENFIFPVTS